MLKTELLIPNDMLEVSETPSTALRGAGWPSIIIGPNGTQSGLHIDTHHLPFWIAVANAATPGVPLNQPPQLPGDKSASEGGRDVCTAPFGSEAVSSTFNSYCSKLSV